MHICPTCDKPHQRKFWLLVHDLAEDEDDAKEYCWGIFSTVEKAKSYFKDGHILNAEDADSIEWTQPHTNQEIYRGVADDGECYEIRSLVVDE